MKGECVHGVDLTGFCSDCKSAKFAKPADAVNHPAHYTAGDIECIDAIAAALGPDGFNAFLRGQILKYAWRCGLKDSALQDAQKAAWYAGKLVEVLA
jgi:hypothetical protein